MPTIAHLVVMFVIVLAGFMKSGTKEGWAPALLPQERLHDLSSARAWGSNTSLPGKTLKRRRKS